MKYTQGWKWKNVTLSVRGPRRRRPRSVKRHLSEIFLTFFSTVFLSAGAVLRESVNPDYILAPYWLRFSQFYVLQISRGSPEDWKKNRIPRLLLLPPMNLKLGFKTVCSKCRWIFKSCHCWRPCFLLLLLNPAPISVRHQRPGPLVDPLSS